ncbi:hypothetical protein ACFOOK_04585 [Micromonospora krabiensis]|uniref:Cellulose binding domain-containing protein n=1 Tax=Micromonospora krabiensis TaxID=307121 RepID=A0A1C3NDV3_9ACTN|nr:hypothetical protein [Micromonospora krabiensis]SBV30731.1 hypothetical protein GA0070620_6332 [Micromonospora krabiensis]
MPVRPVGPRESGTAPKVVASVPWIVVVLVVVTLVTIVLVASLSFRGRESEPAADLPPLALPIAPPSSTAPVSGSPGPSSRQTAEARPSRSATRSAPASRTPSHTPAAPRATAEQQSADGGGAVVATYRVRDVDPDSVEAELLVTNDTGRAEAWTVRLDFGAAVRGVRVVSGGGVSLTSQGDGRFVLSGRQALGAGASVELGLHLSLHVGVDVRTGCTVNGDNCVLG